MILAGRGRQYTRKKNTRFQATEKVRVEDVSEGDPVVSEVQVRRPGEGRVTGSQERTPERSLPASAGAAAVRAPFAGVARPACLLGGTCSQGWQRAAPLGILFRVGTARRPLSRTRPELARAHAPFAPPVALLPCASVSPSHAGTSSWKHPLLPAWGGLGVGLSVRAAHPCG